MPHDFFFTQTSENAVGGRFRMPQIIDPKKIAVSVEEAFAQNVKSVLDTRYLEAMFRQDLPKIDEGVRTGQIEAVFGERTISGLIGLPVLSPGTGRPVKFRKAEQGGDYYRELDLPQRLFPAFMDVKIYEFPVISKVHYPPSLLVVHTTTKHEEGQPLDGSSHPFHGLHDFLKRYAAYNKIGAHTVPEEFASQNWTDVYLYTDDIFQTQNGFSRRAMDTFYHMMKTGQVQKALGGRDVNLNTEYPAQGERYEREEECRDCGRLYTFFGGNHDDVVAGKTSMLYCSACGNDRENGFRTFYSRPLSPSEVPHFELLATLAADCD